ncbi:MAG TPA: hypothetical protein VM802_20825 [Chitinophaga sp.]|uniref:hypothetical protein n=1 Tax=Chitinophaga sp. TaxID=1869181 RepID=UPI002CED8A07|nr:hypothetical protein [Chitinophaga sp.]HVI47335.1 hypothetical protein [Chitinophaga sp.]
MHAEFSAAQSSHAFVGKAPSSNKRKAGEKIKATEIEEDEDPVSFRKLLETGMNLITLFYAPERGCCNTDFHNIDLPYSTHFSYADVDMFIVHRVIRI